MLQKREINKMAGGRPTEYTEELAERVCDLIAHSIVSLDKLRAEHNWFPTPDTIRQWSWKNQEFSAKYFEARKHQADLTVLEQERLLEESLILFNDKDGNTRIDAASVQLAALKCKNAQWTAARVLPKKWGAQEKAIEDLSSQNLQLVELVAKLSKDFKSDI